MGHFDKRKTWHLILHTLYEADRATHYLQYLQRKKKKKKKYLEKSNGNLEYLEN